MPLNTYNTYGAAPTRAATLDPDSFGADLRNHRAQQAQAPEPHPQAAPDGADSPQGDPAMSSAHWYARCGHDAARFRRAWSREAPVGPPPSSTWQLPTLTPQALGATVGNLAQQAGLSQRNLLAGAAILGIAMLARGGLSELANVGCFMGSQLGASLADALSGGLWSDVYRPVSFGSCAFPYVGPFARGMTAAPDLCASWMSSPWSGPVSTPHWGAGFGFGQPGGWGGGWGGFNGWAPW